MKIKTSELIGAALDLAVAKCEGHDVKPWLIVSSNASKTRMRNLSVGLQGDRHGRV